MTPDSEPQHAIGARSGTVLVAFASKRGGTAEIAEMIAESLRGEGLDAVCARAGSVKDVGRYSAVVVGAGLYANRWLREARRFVVRRAAALRTRPVWMFSSGPLGESATAHEPPPTRSVAELMARVGARGHVTFGGRLTRDAKRFPASAMAKKLAGDWRDPDRIRSWARTVARDLVAHPTASPYVPPSREVALSTLCLATGATAIAGGVALVAAPDGHLVHLSPSLLLQTPFSTFLIPGLLLATVVGVTNLAAGLAVRRHGKHAHAMAAVAGLALWGWIVAQMRILHTARVLQIAYLLLSIVIVGLALRPRMAWNKQITSA